jgi:cobalt/nickel transport system permease protein
VFQVDQYAYSNNLRHVHPGEKVAYALITMIICMAAPGILVPLLVMLLMAATVILRAGIPPRVYFKLLCLPLGFLLAGALTVALTVSRVPDPAVHGLTFYGFTVGVTVPGLQRAGFLLVKSLGAVSCLYFLSLTTPVVEIISVLRRLRVPAVFIELMGLIYRFIFVIMDTAEKMYVSQSSRWGYASLKTAYNSLGQLVSNLFIKSYYRSQALFTTLMARGYTGEIRVLERPFPLSKKNLALIALVDVLLMLLSLVTWRWPL